MTKIISLSNQKGGVGKTTTCVNLAACLAERKQKVLVVDVDPQGNATSGLGLERKQGGSIYDALLDQGDLRPYIKQTTVPNLDLIPSERDLAGAEIELPQSDNYLTRLRGILHPLRETGSYDVIFIDCPPSFGILSMNALIAADTMIIPLQCEYYSLEGVTAITDMIGQLHRSRTNPNLGIEGILMTMFDSRTILSRQVINEVRKQFGAIVYETMIPRTVRLSEAPSHGQSIIDYDPGSAGAMAYRKLAREFVQRQKAAAATDLPELQIAEREGKPAPSADGTDEVVLGQPEADVAPPELLPE